MHSSWVLVLIIVCWHPSTDSVVKLWDTSNWSEVRTLSMPNTADAISRVSRDRVLVMTET
jgi:hypothetical protein